MLFIRWGNRANNIDPGASKRSLQPSEAASTIAAAPMRNGMLLAQDFPAALEDWSDTNIGTTLERLFALTVQCAERRIAWYNRNGTIMGKRSRRLRFWAIICGTLGTLFPLFGAAWTVPVEGLGIVSLGYLGYVLLAIAAALIAGDSAFGVSSSWMRFRFTQIEMERLLARFRFEWTSEMAIQNGHVPNAEQRKRLLHIHRGFTDAIEASAQNETTGWMQEFRGALAELARTYKSTIEPRQSGTANIQVNTENKFRRTIRAAKIVPGQRATAQQGEINQNAEIIRRLHVSGLGEPPEVPDLHMPSASLVDGADAEGHNTRRSGVGTSSLTKVSAVTS